MDFSKLLGCSVSIFLFAGCAILPSYHLADSGETETFCRPTCVADEERIVERMFKTDDVKVWNKGVELVTDESLLADIAIAAHKFGEFDGKVRMSVLPAGLRAVEKLTKKAMIEKVYENARTNEVRDAAKAKR